MGFHVFGDKFKIPDEEVKTQMFRYMSDNYSEIAGILQDFLKAKGQEQCDYVEYMSREYAKADQLALYLCARLFQIHIALICKDRVWYSFNGDGDFSDCDIILLYKGANVWKNTTELSLPRPLQASRRKVSAPSSKKKSKYEHDPDYVPDFSENDLLSEEDVKEEIKPDIRFPEAQPVINLISDDDSDLPTIPEDDESDSEATIIYNRDTDSSNSDSDATIIMEPEERPKATVVKVVPAKSYNYGVKSESRKLLCKMCSAEFQNKRDLDAHVSTLHVKQQRKYHCTYPQCNEVFDTDATRSSHMFSVHGAIFKCSKCFKSFVDKRNLNKHVKRHDPGNLKYKCSLCSYAGLFPSELEMHMTGHIDHRPFKCPKCPKTYRTKGVLSDHIQVQHAEDPWFQCDKCPQKFKGKKLLGIHQRTHGEPTFQCDLCGEKFKHYQHLTVHRKKCTTFIE